VLLLLLLFSPPLVAFTVVIRGSLTGAEVVRPFALTGLLAFLLSGILLVATLLAGGPAAVTYLEMGVAAFGGAIMSGTVAVSIWFRQQREAHEQRGQRPWPHRGEED
jgi:Na+-driven multidrug efflux pump